MIPNLGEIWVSADSWVGGDEGPRGPWLVTAHEGSGGKLWSERGFSNRELVKRINEAQLQS